MRALLNAPALLAQQHRNIVVFRPDVDILDEGDLSDDIEGLRKNGIGTGRCDRLNSQALLTEPCSGPDLEFIEPRVDAYDKDPAGVNGQEVI